MMKWKKWKYGWGEDCYLARGLTLSAYKGDIKGSKFSFTVFNLKSKNEYDTIDEAKNKAELKAKQLLQLALREME